MRKIIFACAVLISMPVVPAAGEPLVRLHTSYYYIDGPSAAMLAATRSEWAVRGRRQALCRQDPLGRAMEIQAPAAGNRVLHEGSRRGG
jgi:hypothetical protein